MREFRPLDEKHSYSTLDIFLWAALSDIVFPFHLLEEVQTIFCCCNVGKQWEMVLLLSVTSECVMQYNLRSNWHQNTERYTRPDKG
jgi:hypothetical protein